MEIFTVDKVLFLPVDPSLLSKRLTFWAMPVAAGVVRYLLETALIAAIDMRPLSRCPTGEYGVHSFRLNYSQAMRTPVVDSVQLYDILQLNHTAHTGRRG